VLTLEDAIKHAGTKAEECEKAGDEACEFEHRQLVLWLAELHSLRYHSEQLESDLEATRKKLEEVQRAVLVSMDENVHVTVDISRLGEGWRYGVEISGEAWNYLPRYAKSERMTESEHKSQMLRTTIEKVAYEAALGFFSKTEKLK